ncbi:hypothetical protein [Streptosporangium sandarakinum]|uniref:hypothetical protein n=1 Tax=Streptosporangium sandarakinum TaxID=1260955 RepID=UPI0037AF0C32
MTRWSLGTQILCILGAVLLGVLLGALDAAAHLLAVAVLTVIAGMVLPLPAAFVLALLAVCAVSGYLTARRIDRARMRGEIR